MPSLRVWKVCLYVVKFAKVRQFAPYLPLSFIAVWVIFLLSFVALPAHAQGPILTPTPLPAIATAQAQAAQNQSAAQAKLDEARRMEAQAAEMRRNGEAQAAQAQADIEAARQAAAAQNGVEFGEYIGRVEASLKQLRDTVNGQAQLLDSASKTQAAQAATIDQQIRQIQALETDKRTILANFNAMSDAKEQAAKDGDSNTIIYVGVGALVLCLLAIVAIAWRNHRSVTVVRDDSDDYADPVEGEFSKMGQDGDLPA